jgi:hypothetical protein
MGLFGIFRKKSPGNAMQEEMLRLASVIFPGGHEQIQAAGRSISAMLDNRIPPDRAAQLYTSTKYLAHTASDKTKPRVVEYILSRGMGILSAEDAAEIYDRFIVATSPNAARQSPRPSTGGTLFINKNLAGREYTLTNSSRSVRIDAALFTTLVLGLRSTGWSGAANLFDTSGTAMKVLPGSYPISERDAKDIASLLSGLIASRGINREIEAVMAPLIAIASHGAFTLHA